MEQVIKELETLRKDQGGSGVKENIYKKWFSTKTSEINLYIGEQRNYPRPEPHNFRNSEPNEHIQTQTARVIGGSRGNEGFEKASYPGIVALVLIEKLEKKVEALEKRNAELEQNSSGSQDMSAILNRLDNLEKRNNELEDTVNHLQMKCATQESEIEEHRNSETFLPPPPYDEAVQIIADNWDDSSDDDWDESSDEEILTVLIDTSETSSTFTQPLYEARKGHAAQSCLGKVCSQCKHRLPRGFNRGGNYFCSTICSDRYQKENSHEKPQSRLLNYCTQCKQGKSSKGFNTQGKYFCTAICAKQYQKEKSPTNGNFTSVMNPALYN